MKIPIIVLKFLFIGALFILSNHDLRLQDASDLSVFGNLYYDWLSSLFEHAKNITGYVSGADWLPEINQSLLNSSG